jgi:rhodanese-related sulfurtransferase
MNMRRNLLLLLIVAGLSALTIQAQTTAPPAVEMITADELKAKMSGNHPVTIIDVRSSEGYASSSTTIKGAMHFKVRKLKSRLTYAPLKDLPKDREIVTYCACPKDQSSIAAAQILQGAGFKRVKVLQGGWQEWLRVSGPVEPRAKTD